MNRAEFHPNRINILVALIMVLMTFVVVGMDPARLWWIALLPLLLVWWTLRSRTLVDDRGIHARYGFKGPASVAWEDADSLGFKGGRAFLTSGAKRVTLPGVSFNDVPALAAASGGRITDAVSLGRAAADDSVVVIHRDGRQVLTPKEDAAADADPTQ